MHLEIKVLFLASVQLKISNIRGTFFCTKGKTKSYIHIVYVKLLLKLYLRCKIVNTEVQIATSTNSI